MAKDDWWLKLDINDWLTDPQLRRLTRANRDSWLTACLMMRKAGDYKLSGTASELALLLSLTADEFTDFINDLKQKDVANVTLRRDFVTLVSRRYKRELNTKEKNTLRKRKQRGHVDVTPMSQDIVNSNKKRVISNKDSNKESRASPSAPPAPKNGTRLPERFFLTSEMKAWATDKRSDVDVTLETEKFCNYYRSAPGSKGLSLDWEMTWRNWILNAKAPARSARSKRMSSPLVCKHDPDNVIDFVPTACATCGSLTCLKDHRMDAAA